MKRRLSKLLTFRVAAWALGPCLASADAPGDADGPGGRCSLAGAWYGENTAGYAFLITMVPTDNAHRGFAAIADADGNPPGDGAVDATAFHGNVVRTGPRTFAQTGVSYVRDDSAWISTYHVAGAWELTDDCDTAEVRWEVAVYLSFQDPFADEPIACLPPIIGTYKRIPVAASPCPEQ